MKKSKNIASNNQSIKRFLSPQPPAIQCKKRRKVTTSVVGNTNGSNGGSNVVCLDAPNATTCGAGNKNNDSATSPRNPGVDNAMQEQNVDWNSFVCDPGEISGTRYPITLNTFKTMTHYGNVVRCILEDMKNSTGLDFLNDEIIKERVLGNYYKQFYEQPQIRDRYKLEIKACPTFVKKKIMEIPTIVEIVDDVSTNTGRSVPLEAPATAELVCPQIDSESAATLAATSTVETVSQQSATPQNKMPPKILRILNKTLLNDTTFLLRHIKRHVQERSNKQYKAPCTREKHVQAILARIKAEVLQPAHHMQCIQGEPKNVSQENTNDAEQSVISLSSSSESIVINSVEQRLQQVKDIYFKAYVKSNALPYALRMAKGLKRQIIATILNITFEEFTKYTHIYKGSEIYEDLDLLGGYYDYAIKEPQIWPVNLYMTVKDLCEFLKTKSVSITTANLTDIPPILLHWEELAALTNFDKIVSWDYYRSKGERLRKEETELLNAHRKIFYEKCWHQNIWLRGVPQFLYMPDMVCIPVMNDKRQSIKENPNSKQMVSEQKVGADVERCANVAEETQTQRGIPTMVVSAPNNSIQNAEDTDESEATEQVNADCEMPDLGLNQKTVAAANDDQVQESVAVIDDQQMRECLMEQPSKSSLTLSTPATSDTALDLMQIDVTSVQDIVVQERLQKAQDLYFKEVPKSYTIPYILRLHRGLKRRIIAAIANMTFTEFQHYTNIFDAAEIYKDAQLLQRCYDYTFKEPQVWPINLYMRLADLFKFLHTKDVTLTACDLKYVSPKYLHWLDLIAMTNYDYIVYWDYYRNSGNKLNRSNTSLDSYCQNFYAKCWHQDKWIWHTPRILPDVTRDFVGAQFLKAVEFRAGDNKNIMFEQAVKMYALKKKNEVEIIENVEQDPPRHTVEIQTTQRLEDDGRQQQEQGKDQSKTTEAPDKVTTVDAEIQTSQNLLRPLLSSAETCEPSNIQSSNPCLPLPTRDIKEEKLTPLNKLQFNLTIDDGDKYECVQAPDDVIELDTTLLLPQSPQDILLPLSNSENLDTNNFNNLLTELQNLPCTQNMNEQQESEIRSEQELSVLNTQENLLKQTEQMTEGVNGSSAEMNVERDTQNDKKQPQHTSQVVSEHSPPLLNNTNSNNSSTQLLILSGTIVSQEQDHNITSSPKSQESVRKQQKTMEKLTNVAELTNEPQIMSQVNSKSQTTQQQSSLQDKEINEDGKRNTNESVVESTNENNSQPSNKVVQIQPKSLKSEEIKLSLQRYLKTTMEGELVLEVREQSLNREQEPLIQQEQLIEDEEILVGSTVECAEAPNDQQKLQQQHEETYLEEEVSTETDLVKEISVENSAIQLQEVVITEIQQKKHHQQNLTQHQQQQQQTESHQNHYQQQEHELQLQLKELERQQQELQLQIKQHQQRELQLQLQQQQFEQLQLQLKQTASNTQQPPVEQLKQAEQQEEQTTSKAAIQQQKQHKVSAEQNIKKQGKAKSQQDPATELKKEPQTEDEQQQPNQSPTFSQQTTGMEQQHLGLEQLVMLTTQDSLEQEPKREAEQEESDTSEQSMQVCVQQNEQETQEEEQEQLEKLREEIKIETSPQVAEKPNLEIESTSENSLIDEKPNTEFDAHELPQQLTATQQQYTTVEQQHYATIPTQQQQCFTQQQNSTSQQPQIILQRTSTHVQEQFMFGPTITSTQDMTTSNRQQVCVSEQQIRTETATTTATKTKTVRAIKTKTATTKRKVGTKNSDYVPQLTHVFPALPVALNNKKMSPKAASKNATIVTPPSTCDTVANNQLQLNQLVAVSNEQHTLIPQTSTPNTTMLLTVPTSTSLATSTNSTSANNLSSYVYGLSGDNTFFNSSQLLQIIEQYQLQNKQTSEAQQQALQPLPSIQQLQLQLQQPHGHYEQQALYVYEQPTFLQLEQTSYSMQQQQQQQQQQLQVFQQAPTQQQFPPLLPPPLVPIQSKNAVMPQQRLLQESQQKQCEQLLQQIVQQTQEQHEPQYVVQQLQQQQHKQPQQFIIQQQTHEVQQNEQLQHEDEQQIQQAHLNDQTTTTHQPIVYQLLDVTQMPPKQNGTVQQHQQQELVYRQRRSQQEYDTQLQGEIGIGSENAHITEYKDEEELEQILKTLNSTQERSLEQQKHHYNKTTEMLQVNIRIEHNYSKSAPQTATLNKILAAQKFSALTKGTVAFRMRPSVRLKPFHFRQLETLDYFNQITSLNIADYQLQCNNIGQPYLQAKIRTSNGITLVIFGDDMLTSLLPRCTPTLLQDLSTVLQYLDEFHYNKWQQREQRKQISKFAHRTLHTLSAHVLLVYFTFSSPFQTRNEVLSLRGDATNVEHPNFWSAAATKKSPATTVRPAAALDDLSMAIEPSILEQMAALKCNL